jgi:hypothetical protein
MVLRQELDMHLELLGLQQVIGVEELDALTDGVC